MIEKVSAGTVSAYVDMLLFGADGSPIIISYFDRSAQVVRSIGGELIWNNEFSYRHRLWKYEAGYVVNYGTIVEGKERFTHGIAVAKDLKNSYLVTTEEDLYADLYNMLMNKYALPLLERWMPLIFERMICKHYLTGGQGIQIVGAQNRKIVRQGKAYLIKDLLFYKINMSEEALEEMITGLFRDGSIYISENPQKKLYVENMDSYFKVYGKSIVDNLRNVLQPISELDGEISRVTLKKTRLYPQQAAMVNGIYEYLRKGNRKAFYIMETGTGKTVQAAAAAEMLYVGKWLEQNPGKTLSDAYEKPGIINYRHIVMCPGHVAEKWVKEIKKEIPYAKATIINDFSILTEIKKGGRARKNGKEFFVISKDFCKLSYQKIPAPQKEARKQVYVFKCKSCGTIQTKRTKNCMYCNSTEIELIPTRYKRHGLICPHCNRLAFSENFLYSQESMQNEDEQNTWPLQWYDMVMEKDSNQRCYYCGSELWQPYVKNLNTALGSGKKSVWHSMTFYKNMARKGRVTYWIMYGREFDARKRFGESIADLGSSGGCRKYAPALYIKKQLKGYFDVFIADELHKAKGGATAQGNAFHSIMSASRFTLGLTGTIAGGMATDLFYILFRMFPKRMKQHGYSWNSVMKFAEDYGCIGTYFMPTDSDAYRGKISRGRQIQAPKVLPGISPLIFSEFLLDCSVFLNLSDMSANMPKLSEQIVLVEPGNELEEEMVKSCWSVVNTLKDYERTAHVNLAGVRNQFGISYLDHPYGVPAIRDPKSGEEICEPENYRVLIENGGMLAKEAKLIEILKAELGSNRNCVVYVEYSQDEVSNVLFRLQDLIYRECGLSKAEVVVMQSGYPAAIKREAWMHERAKEGMRVLICNPRLCETGLDFCWEEAGNMYNYPNLIFYQVGYSLYITWQAAGRAWRLNQREECHTYYLGYARTVQQAILQVLGEKKAATAAIQGKFSADGLAAMAEGVDTQVRIAQIMSEMDEDSGNRLQEMFDVIEDSGDDTYTQCNRMKLFNEIVKVVEELPADEMENFQKTIINMGMMLGFGNSAEMEISAESDMLSPKMNLFMTNWDMVSGTALTSSSLVPKKKKHKVVHVYEECSIFGQ